MDSLCLRMTLVALFWLSVVVLGLWLAVRRVGKMGWNDGR
jgi:hypothetical protein